MTKVFRSRLRGAAPGKYGSLWWQMKVTKTAGLLMPDTSLRHDNMLHARCRGQRETLISDGGPCFPMSQKRELRHPANGQVIDEARIVNPFLSLRHGLRLSPSIPAKTSCAPWPMAFSACSTARKRHSPCASTDYAAICLRLPVHAATAIPASTLSMGKNSSV